MEERARRNTQQIKDKPRALLPLGVSKACGNESSTTMHPGGNRSTSTTFGTLVAHTSSEQS